MCSTVYCLCVFMHMYVYVYTTSTTHCRSSNDHGRSHIVHNNTYRYPVYTCDIRLTSVNFWSLHVTGNAKHE